MTLITRSSTVGLGDFNPKNKAVQISHVFAGQALHAAAPCVINGDGEVVLAGSAVRATDSEIVITGWTPQAYADGDPVTLFVGPGIRFNYGTDLTSGSLLYVSSASAGWLDTSAKQFTLVNTSGSAKINDRPAAMIISSEEIITLR